MEEHTVYVRKRPFLKSFLERVSEMFEIVIFTASESVYAGQLLDILDPEGKFFSRRVYRDSCIIINGNYTKDLTILGVDLAKCAIVDNCPQVVSPSILHLLFCTGICFLVLDRRGKQKEDLLLLGGAKDPIYV